MRFLVTDIAVATKDVVIVDANVTGLIATDGVYPTVRSGNEGIDLARFRSLLGPKRTFSVLGSRPDLSPDRDRQSGYNGDRGASSQDRMGLEGLANLIKDFPSQN